MARSRIRAKAVKRAARSLGLFALFLASIYGRAFAQSSPDGTPPPAPSPSASTSTVGAIPIDGVAARIEDDVITESEVRELAAFQTLVDGQARPRADLIRELADQWIIRSEATATRFQRPSHETLEHAFADFVKQFSSPDEFKQRCRNVGLSEAAVRRMLEEQLYLSRFIEYRFRPAAQVDDKQIEAYYRDEFAPQLKQRNEPVPPLEDVEETIHEVLVQRIITERSTQWLDDSREHLKIDIVSQDGSR